MIQCAGDEFHPFMHILDLNNDTHISGTPKFPTGEPMACFSLCIRPTYCLLTMFHAAMYFSIHALIQPCSFVDNDDPGEGMHFSKQFSLTFYKRTLSA